MSADWVSASAPPRLTTGHIHLWRFRVDADVEDPAVLLQLLTKEEQAKAAGFGTRTLASQFVVNRASLRRLLSLYVHEVPTEICFDYGPHGKPALKVPDPKVGFNLTHSGPLSLLAIQRHPDIGVDVERTSRCVDYSRVARRFFAVDEFDYLHSLPEEQRHQAFFECWTRKEAYLKARGQGVAGGLDRFSVSFGPNRPSLLLRTADDTKPSGWVIQSLSPWAETAAAVCAPAPEQELVRLQWSPHI
ncbi:MAG: 4'-phosphopantetheinyl transferase superfamily protein [Candidatus Latescibacterota bacterium]|nr:4'-phosphopantetheinyl transferase superfamily protein [Candidatus Latescibacterota bacterium]